MENIVVKNYQSIEDDIHGEGSTLCTTKHIIDNVQHCSADFIQLNTGNYTYYRYHGGDETVFYVIFGQASLRTANGDVDLYAGDVVHFFNDVKGDLVIQNTGEDDLFLLAVTAISPVSKEENTHSANIPRPAHGVFRFKR